MHDPIGRIRIDVISEDLERIGMGIHRVLLTVVDGHGAVRCHDIACFVLVIAVLAGKGILVDHIGIDDIAKGFGNGDVVVPYHAVTDKSLAIVGQDAAVKQMRVLALRIVVAVLGIDVVLAILDIGGPDDMGNGGLGVVVEGIRDEHRLGPGRRSGVDQTDIVVKDGLMGGRAVLSPVAGQLVVVVKDTSALEVIAEVVETVIVEAVGIDGHRAVLELHIIARPGQLVESVVVEHLADERERVSLVHEHMTESIEGIGGLVIKGAVAVKEHAVVAELHMPHQNLGGAMHPLVEEETIGMQQVHLAVGRRSFPGSFANRRHRHKQADAEEQGRTKEV